MPDEAQRLARREYEQGRREGLDAAHTEEQDRHLAAINGSVDEFRLELKAFAKQLTSLDKTVSGILLVTEALEKKGVSTRQFAYGVATLLVPILILIVGLVATNQ